jgi:acyl-homoserine-lactone acylase
LAGVKIYPPLSAKQKGESVLSLKEYNRSMKALEEAWLITKANTFAQYKKAMDLRANTTNNTVYADDQGNIAYWHGNFMPRRDPKLDWTLPVDGTASKTQWGPPISPDSIVHVFNPGNGWIQNCNSTPFSVAGTYSPKAKDYPAYMAPDGENYRAVNAVRLLSNAHGLTLDSLIHIGYSHYLAAFEAFLPPLIKAWDSLPDQDTLKNILATPIAQLKNWDRCASDTSVATTLAIEWGTKVYRRASTAATTELSTHALDMVASAISNTPGSLMLAYLDTVVNTLRLNNGTWSLPWGKLNRYQRLTGKINETYDDRQPSLPVGFAPSTFGSLPSFQSRYMPGTTKRYGYSGNSFIAAIEFGPRVTARTIATGGNSSDPHSSHFTDQAQGYIDGKLKEVYFYKEDVLKNVEKQYHPGEE